MAAPSPTAYGLLGLLAVRPWTGYELTKQVRRSLRFVWPASEGHLYREQRNLVERGWATVVREPAGQRSRNRYTITDAGRAALRDWLGSDGQEEPHFQIEGVLRTFFGDQAPPAELSNMMLASAHMSRTMLDEMVGFVDEYLQDGGPLWMLEQDLGGPDDRLEFRGRPMFPERLHAVALAIDVTTQLLAVVEEFFSRAAGEVATWPTTTDASITPSTRARLERIRARRGAN